MSLNLINIKMCNFTFQMFLCFVNKIAIVHLSTGLLLFTAVCGETFNVKFIILNSSLPSLVTFYPKGCPELPGNAF